MNGSSFILLHRRVSFQLINQVRTKCKDVDLPSNSGPKAGRFRRIVHYPEEYTVKPLNVTNLAGRDPVSGRLVVQGLGGGIKHKYHWIQWKREGPSEGPPLVEKVIAIIEDGCRSANVALVASGNKLKYYIATENMKPGDLIKTSQNIPRNPIVGSEGDAYPLGALIIGSIVCNVEKYPGLGGFLCHAAGTFATIMQRNDDRIVIKVPSKKEFSLLPQCMATVGRISNVEHGNTPIGSAQRARELGYRPRSGLWHRKDGRFGRKIRQTPPVRFFDPHSESKDAFKPRELKLTFDTDMQFENKLHPRARLW